MTETPKPVTKQTQTTEPNKKSLPDPNAAPAVGKSSLELAQERQIEMVNNARADGDARRYNKDWFYTNPRVDYRETRLDHLQGDTHGHYVTAEELALDILSRAGIANNHPELAEPLVGILKTHLDKNVYVYPDKRV